MAKYIEYFQTGAIIFILSVLIVVGVVVWAKYEQNKKIIEITKIESANE